MNSWNEPGSARRSMRSRTVSLPCACWRATPSGPPMRRASSRRRCSSSTSGIQVIDLSPSSPLKGASDPPCNVRTSPTGRHRSFKFNLSGTIGACPQQATALDSPSVRPYRAPRIGPASTSCAETEVAMPVRSGAQYLAGLRDGRRVLCDGRWVGDVTAEPGFRNTARAIAQFYDFQNRPALRDVMTYETEDGDRAGMAFIEPRSKDDLRRRAAAFAAWAEATCGLIGRSPDYMNACMMMVGAAAVHLGAHDPVFGERARNIYLDARRRDLCFTHTFIPAHVDRNRPPSEQPASLRVLRETSEGPIVSGARVVATLAPFSDANLVILGGPLNLENDPGAESMAIAFTCPANAPGLRWSCRDVLDHERPLYDAPLAGRIDEQDALAIFEEVLVPWENVFVYRDLEI